MHDIFLLCINQNVNVAISAQETFLCPFFIIDWPTNFVTAAAACEASHSMTTPLHAAASRMLASGTGTSSVAGRICSCSQKSLGVRTLRRDRKALRGFGNGLDQRKYGHDRRWNLCANDDERRERAKEKQNAFMKG